MPGYRTASCGGCSLDVCWGKGGGGARVSLPIARRGGGHLGEGTGNVIFWTLPLSESQLLDPGRGEGRAVVGVVCVLGGAVRLNVNLEDKRGYGQTGWLGWGAANAAPGVRLPLRSG